MILRVFAVFAVLLVVSSCTVFRVTTHRAVDSIGEKQIPVEDKSGKASVSLYQLDGVIYLALPVYYISDPATIVEATSFPYPDRYYLDIAESQKLELSETCLYKPVDEYDLMAWNSEFKTAFRYQRCKNTLRHYIMKQLFLNQRQSCSIGESFQETSYMRLV